MPVVPWLCALLALELGAPPVPLVFPVPVVPAAAPPEPALAAPLLAPEPALLPPDEPPLALPEPAPPPPAALVWMGARIPTTSKAQNNFRILISPDTADQPSVSVSVPVNARAAQAEACCKVTAGHHNSAFAARSACGRFCLKHPISYRTLKAFCALRSS